jgi:hypothetical protein
MVLQVDVAGGHGLDLGVITAGIGVSPSILAGRLLLFLWGRLWWPALWRSLPGHPTPAFFSPESCEKSTKNFSAYHRAWLVFLVDFLRPEIGHKVDINQ